MIWPFVKPFAQQEKTLADINTAEYLKLAATVLKSPGKLLWTRYDQQADVLYINFRKPSNATDSELTDDDVIIRYDGDEVIGLTILHAGSR